MTEMRSFFRLSCAPQQPLSAWTPRALSTAPAALSRSEFPAPLPSVRFDKPGPLSSADHARIAHGIPRCIPGTVPSETLPRPPARAPEPESLRARFEAPPAFVVYRRAPSPGKTGIFSQAAPSFLMLTSKFPSFGRYTPRS